MTDKNVKYVIEKHAVNQKFRHACLFYVQINSLTNKYKKP